jgi:hypothetical protein
MQHRADSPETVRDLARACENYVGHALGFGLDYSATTLPVLDQYVRQVRDTLDQRPETLPLLARAVGAYFGEVLCQEMHGFWRLPSENVVDWQVCLKHVFVWINPIGVAYDALAGDAEHAGPGSSIRVAPEDRGLVKARLGQLSDVAQEEYYLLSTRMEVIELVVESLRRHMEESGYGDSSFDESDYEAEQRLAPG